MPEINSHLFNKIFDTVVADYHVHDDIFHEVKNPYPDKSISCLLYAKCWIDTVQWHMEDEVRNPDLEAEEGMKWKRRIDKSNQQRTDIVEQIDDYFYELFRGTAGAPGARLNTESPAWATDRLSILAVKIYHMRRETQRKDVRPGHLEKCNRKLDILLQQRKDLSLAIDELLDDYHSGRKQMKVYRQVKMYNDPSLNPVFYRKE